MKIDRVKVTRNDGVKGSAGHFKSDYDSYLQFTNLNTETNVTYTLHGFIKSTAVHTVSCLGQSGNTVANKWWEFIFQIIPPKTGFSFFFPPGEYWFYNWKLEKGLITTLWTPNGDDITDMKDTIITMGSSIEQLDKSITQKVWMTEVNSAKQEVETHISTVEQTANKIHWLVKSGTDSSNMTLTDKAYGLIAQNIDLTGKVKFSSFDSSTQSRLTPLKPTRTWTSKFTTVGTVTTCNLSDFNRTPVAGDIFSNTDGGSNTGTWQVTVVNGNSVTIKLLSCDAPAKNASDAASDAAKKAKAISDNIYSTNTTTINGGKITTGSITASQIAASAITADKISVKTLSAINANLGTITAGSLSAVSINNGKGTFTVDANGNMTAKSASITGTIKSDDPKTLYSTKIKDGFIYVYGSKNNKANLNGTICSWKWKSDTVKHYPMFGVTVNNGATGFLMNIENADKTNSVKYFLNNGENYNDFQHTHTWYGTEMHTGNMDLLGNKLRFYALNGTQLVDGNKNFVGYINGSVDSLGNYNLSMIADLGDCVALGAQSQFNDGHPHEYYIQLKEVGLKQNIQFWKPAYIGTLHLGANAIVDSDRRLKKDIISLNINKSSEFIYSLNPVSYKYKENNSDRFHHGLIAQELKQSMGDDDWGVYVDNSLNKYSSYPMLGIRYEELIADIIATLQSQNNRIKFLETQIPQLQNQILQLQNKLSNINGGK